jgi:hypothetical protein
MKKLITLFLILVSLTGKSQSILHAGEPDWRLDSTSEIVQKGEMGTMTAGCGTPFLSTGYPLWTNYWAGWMVNIINTNACPIIINSFEARFQGTAGYRIYTKTGTFIGFETTAGAWALVGNVAALTGTSTTAPTAIPIAVNISIPAGATQAFYLTRSDNVIANRHLYTTGAGVAGTTIYALNADLSITEGSYVDPYFAALQVGVRRPSFDVCYTVNCVLPIELLYFNGKFNGKYNELKWSTATETNNDYFTIEKSKDGINWNKVIEVDGAGNSTSTLNYTFNDYSFSNTINYYRLKQTDFDGKFKYSNIIAIDNTGSEPIKPIKITNILGQEVDEHYSGIKIYFYSDGTCTKKIETTY